MVLNSKSKVVISVVFFGLAGFLLWHYTTSLKKFSQNLPAAFKNFSPDNVVTKIQNLEEQVFTPPPLKSTAPKIENPLLDNAGVISWTNTNRKNNGNLAPLKENALLDKAAKIKLDDMFKQQYFEHQNPQGKGPADLANKAGYAYIAIGENLALGFFENNQDLLKAWMNSPGHRANILNTKYQEIGVAVGKGMYKGEETWMAVQEFGRPKSSCPSIELSLKQQINSLQADATQLQHQLITVKADLEAMNPQTQAEYDAYNAKVAEYNSLVKEYNNKVDTLKLITNSYNAQVAAYNACLSS